MGYYKNLKTNIFDNPVLYEALDDLEAALVEIDRLQKEKEELLEKWSNKIAQLTIERNQLLDKCRNHTTV